MREGHEAKVVINDANQDAVRDLIRYFYTGEVSESADFMMLLPVAHRFEASTLVKICASTVVENLCEENVAQSMAALRSFREDEILKEYWDSAISRIQANKNLTEALARGYQ